uniref:Zinc finger, CCHC-type n=1 Tax=Heterorhabditis bacteriophora TaxID=37862 RepID=A0A1I7XJJ8_HETBA
MHDCAVCGLVPHIKFDDFNITFYTNKAELWLVLLMLMQKKRILKKPSTGMENQYQNTEILINSNEIQISIYIGIGYNFQYIMYLISDPGAVREHLQNPDIATKLMKLRDAGIISMR